MTKEAKRFRALEIRRNPWVMGAAMIPFFLIPVVLTGAVLVHPVLAVFLFHLVLIGAMTSFMAWRRNPWPRLSEVSVEVDNDAITVGKKRVPRRELTRGLVVPRQGPIGVHLQKRGPDVELAFSDEREARALLSSLGFDADQSVAAFRTMSRMHASMFRLMGTIFGMVIASFLFGVLGALVAPQIAVPTAFLVLAAAVALLVVPTKVEVGADGVLARWFGRERFFSHGEIDDVRASVMGFGRSKRTFVVLVLSSGERFVLPVRSAILDGGEAEALAARIRDASEVYRRGGAAPQALLMRGDRPHSSWVAALRTREVVGHRSAAVPDDQLWSVVEDAGAEPLERAAAAVALGKSIGAGERERLARAARTTAAPKLRVVLENATSADDEELATQLEELEIEERAISR